MKKASRAILTDQSDYPKTVITVDNRAVTKFRMFTMYTS